MEITGILTAGKFLSSALQRLGKRGQTDETGRNQPGETPAAAGAETTAAIREIAARYDLTRISPQEFSEMLGKLHEAGALTDQQFQELSQIRVDLDQEHVDPDKTLNLLEFYLAKLRKLQGPLEGLTSSGEAGSPGASPEVAAAERRLQWLEKFAAIQAAPERFGLDAQA
jgi:hypothetical protein